MERLNGFLFCILASFVSAEEVFQFFLSIAVRKSLKSQRVSPVRIFVVVRQLLSRELYWMGCSSIYTFEGALNPLINLPTTLNIVINHAHSELLLPKCTLKPLNCHRIQSKSYRSPQNSQNSTHIYPDPQLPHSVAAKYYAIIRTGRTGTNRSAVTSRLKTVYMSFHVFIE